jgi:hypothetical protein
MVSEPQRVFISYSWDSEQHKEWVRNFATRLRADGFDALLDQFEVVPGDHLPTFMERIPDCEYVLIICTPHYKTKSEKREGGVGYEANIISSELFAKQNHRQYIPILRLGDRETAIPLMISGKLWIDLRGDPFREDEYQTLLGTLKGERPMPPPIGERANIASSNVTPNERESPRATEKWEDIKIIGVDLEGVTSPRNDGTRGSSLYKVPFRLSHHPSSQWAQIFVEVWRHPPHYTAYMHRPSIARISKDRLVLDGTTMDEILKYHQETLKLVVNETNKKYREYVDKRE